MENRETKLQLFLRLFLASLFLFSGISKFESIYMLEKQLVDIGVASWSIAPYFSRLLIGFEIILGCAMIDRTYLRRYTLPATGGILVLFTAYLTWLGFGQGFIEGNCGCFGDKLKMTPLEAIIKNLVTLGAVYYLYKTYPNEKKQSWLPIIIISGSVLFWTFLMYKVKVYIKPKQAIEQVAYEQEPSEVETNIKQIDSNVIIQDSLSSSPEESVSKTDVEPSISNQKQTKDPEPEEVIKPKQEVKLITKFAPYQNYSGGVTTDLDEGEKLICLFNATCGHCQTTAKELCELRGKYNLPETYVLLDGDQFFIDFFFDEAGCQFPHLRLEPEEFYPLLGEKNYPYLVWSKNGKVIKEWDYSTYSKENFENAFLNRKK